MKILAIKFKYIGDVAIWVPALRSLREAYPNAELHVLVGEESLAVIEHIPWLDRVWALPRKRGQARAKETWPMIRALRKTRFDISIDFAGNDRGAILSLLIGARKRIGPIAPLGFIGRRFCYNHRIPESPQVGHESLRDVNFLKILDVAPSKNLEPELYSDPSLASYAQKLVSKKDTICHLSTSMPKKEWPLNRWIEFYESNEARQQHLVFTTGPSPREKKLLKQLKEVLPRARTIDSIPSVDHLMAIINEAGAIICGDTSPGHLAAGLGTPVLALFGPTIIQNWSPGGRSLVLWAGACECLGHPHVCCHYPPCMSNIKVETVNEGLEKLLNP